LLHNDLNVAAQSRETLEQATLRDAPKLPAEQSRNLGLGQPEELRRLRLRQTPLMDDFRDFRDKLRHNQHVLAIGKAQVGVHVS
jgi:hypothetical protein